MAIKLVDVFEPSNEAEAQAIVAVLRHQGIEAEVLSFHDTAFDGVFQAQKGWGRLRVQQEDAPEARAIIDEWRQGAASVAGEGDEEEDDDDQKWVGEQETGAEPAGTKAEAQAKTPVEAESEGERKRPAGAKEAGAEDQGEGDRGVGARPEPRSASPARTSEPSAAAAADTAERAGRGGGMGRLLMVWRVLVPLLLVASVALNAVLLIDRYGEQPAQTVKLRDARGKLVLKAYYRKGADTPYRYEEFDRDENLVQEGFDEDGDKRYERVVSYDDQGRIQRELQDEDGDSRFELQLEFTRGKLAARYLDGDHDGAYERCWVYDGNQQPRARYTDRDRDGRFDRIQRLPARAGAPRLDDADGDGFPEQATCRGPEGQPVVWSLLTCQPPKP
jgi:hypothetical protein